MTTREISEEIKQMFSDAIEETTNGLLHGSTDDQVVTIANVKLLIAEAFVDGVTAAMSKYEITGLRKGGGNYARYFKND